MLSFYPGPSVPVTGAGVAPPLAPERGQVSPPASLGVDRDPGPGVDPASDDHLPSVGVRDRTGHSDIIQY